MPPISIRDIDDLRARLNRAEEAINYDIEVPVEKQSVRVLDQLEPEVPFVDEITEPVDYSPYAKIAEQAYKTDRSNTDRYIYDKELSSPDYGVYESPDEFVIGIRGSSPETPMRDFIRDTQVALGSVSTLTGMNFVGEAVNQVDELVKKIKSKGKEKKISLAGHSLGGSIASYFGVDNPDVDVYTFNKGEGLPFLSDAVKCSIYGCQNIKNYRIAGDFASLGSKISNIGTYETLRPVRPTPEVQEEAQLASGYFIEPEFYLPHSVSNFIGRDNKVHLDSNIYARLLAGKIGNVAGTVLPIIGGIAYNKWLTAERQLGSTFQSAQEFEDEILERLDDPFSYGLDIDATAGDIQSQLIGEAVEGATEGVQSFKNTLTNVAGASLLGRSLGEIAGLGFYELFLKE